MKIKLLTASILFLAFTSVAVAQPAFDPGGPGDTAPISGLVYLGMAIAAGLGIKKTLGQDK